MKTPSKIKILHITPHLGGGVGAVLLNYFSKVAGSVSFEHKVVCLDHVNPYALQTAKKAGFFLLGNTAKKRNGILDLAAESDIIVVHWWNHPLLYDFLIRETMPPSRIIFWSHISGQPAPNNFTVKTLKYPDLFVFTTPLSYKVKEVQNLPPHYKNRLRVIWSTGGVERLKKVKLQRHRGFNVGYIGHVSYAKMHPDFLEMSNNVKVPGVKFIIVGGPNNKLIEKEAAAMGIAGKFRFTGFVSEPEKWRYLSRFDVFGYPLAPYHYGTCDQAIQESMAVGVVPVVMANPMESYMVKNGKTGIVVKDKKAYAKAIEVLYKDENLRKLLSRNAREYARGSFSLEKMEEEWDNLFRELLKTPKTPRRWPVRARMGEILPRYIFLESLGSHGRYFYRYCRARSRNERNRAAEEIKKLGLTANWRSSTKSSVHQYNRFLPGDKNLSYWSKLMK